MGLVRRVVEELLSRYGVERWWAGVEPLELLVGIVLSQKTNWKNVRRALNNIRERLGSVEAMADADLREIEDAIRPAGLYRNKAPILKNIAKTLTREKIKEILSRPYEEAKRELTSIKGIGPKTADVFLMFARDEQVLPVDTHISRVMRRLGVAGERDDYETIRAKLEAEVPPEKRRDAHIALIRFGREVCRARNPLCRECLFNDVCQYYRAKH